MDLDQERNRTPLCPSTQPFALKRPLNENSPSSRAAERSKEIEGYEESHSKIVQTEHTQKLGGGRLSKCFNAGLYVWRPCWKGSVLCSLTTPLPCKVLCEALWEDKMRRTGFPLLTELLILQLRQKCKLIQNRETFSGTI